MHKQAYSNEEQTRLLVASIFLAVVLTSSVWSGVLGLKIDPLRNPIVSLFFVFVTAAICLGMYVGAMAVALIPGNWPALKHAKEGAYRAAHAMYFAGMVTVIIYVVLFFVLGIVFNFVKF